MCGVLGLVVRERDPQLRDRGARVYVSNHVTPFDHNMVNLLTRCSTPLLSGPAGFVCWSRGFVELDGQGDLAEALRRFCASRGDRPHPLLLFPEEEATNGREGLLRFSSWPFSIQEVVQPLTLRVHRPLVSVNVAGACWVSELLWALFIPFTVYRVRWLRPVRREPGEASEELAVRVQQLVAAELGLAGTRLTPADKAEHLKRLRHVAPRARAAPPSPPAPLPAGPGPDGRLATLSQRVKEVLPHVPLGVIRRDLARTGCVDATITNLLERPASADRRHPPPPPPPAPEAGSLVGPAPRAGRGPATPPSAGPDRLSSGRPSTLTFAKSPRARHESLRERKEALYEQARRRFLEKHARRPEDGP